MSHTSKLFLEFLFGFMVYNENIIRHTLGAIYVRYLDVRRLEKIVRSIHFEKFFGTFGGVGTKNRIFCSTY